MRTLERITVTGYKSIRELRDFELGDINVLIGANGAGKSNFLSAFNLLNQLANRRLQFFVGKSDGADTLLHFGRKRTTQIHINVLVTGNVNYDVTLDATNNNRLVIASEKVWFKKEDGEIYEDSQAIASGETQALRNSLVAVFYLDFGKIFHFQDTTPEARVKQTPDIYDNHELKPDAANLASFLYLLKNHNEPYYNRILNTVKLAAPFIEDFTLNPMPENVQRIRLRWKHKNAEDDFDISQLSDGTLRFICLTTLLLQPNPPSLIIIDEPELGLHPAAMELLVEMIRSVATKSQVIISTQSVSMVSQFLPEEIIVVEREKDESVFRRKSSKELETWLDEYSMGELWEMNVIGGRP